MSRFKIVILSLCLCALTLSGCGANLTKNNVSTSVEDEKINTECITVIKQKGTLTVGCKMDVPGLSYYDEKTKTWSGLEIELAYKTASKIFDVSVDEAKEKGLVHFEGVTVEDREDKLESGAIDCMFATYTITDERKRKFDFSKSYYTDYIGVMVKNYVKDQDSLGSKGIQSIADLDGAYIGVPRKATTRDAFLKYIETMNSVKTSPIFCQYENYEQLYKALKKGDIDAIAVDVSILNGYLDPSTKILSERFGGQHYGAATKKENKALLEYINQAIEE